MIPEPPRECFPQHNCAPDYEHLHSIYIHYAAECGLPAALFLTAALVLGLADFHRALKALPAGRSLRRFILEAAMACLIGTMTSGLTEKSLGDTEVLTMFLSIVSLGYLAVLPQVSVESDTSPENSRL